MASSCSSKGRAAGLSLSQKLEVMKLSEEGLSKAKTGWEVDFLHPRVSHAVNTKEKFLKELKILL